MFRPLAGFRDPARRPRYIIWVAVAVMVIVILWAFALVATCAPWFCETPCHIVHDDNTLAYNAGTHSKITCVACHEPVNANPIQFTILKIFVIPDLYSTITKTFDLPMNAYNETALNMPTKQCTQCHNLATRKVNSSAGIMINHDAHLSRGVQCTMCHNRVAHPEENITLVLPGDEKHQNWMNMQACFRCHSQESSGTAPGACDKCHPKSFNLVPASHESTSWYNLYGNSTGHAQAALAASSAVATAMAEAASHSEKGEVESQHSLNSSGEVEPTNTSMETVYLCSMCHPQKFCNDCHGIAPIPHAADFKKTHGQLGYKEPQVCAKCHARSKAEAQGLGFCNACHHPASTPGGSWISEHPAQVNKHGATPCYQCHDELQCSYCHVNGVTAGRANLKSQFQGKTQ